MPAYAAELDDDFANSEYLNPPMSAALNDAFAIPSSSINDMFATSMSNEIIENAREDIDMNTSSQAISPEQHSRTESGLINFSAGVGISESSQPIYHPNSSDSSQNNINLSPPSQDRMIKDCEIDHKPANWQTLKKMESSRLFSEKADRIDKHTKDSRRIDNSEKQKGAFNVYNSRVHYITSIASHGKLPNTVLSFRNSADGKSTPGLIFLNGNNSMSSPGMFFTPIHFAKLVDIINDFLENPRETCDDNLSSNIRVVLQRFSIKIISEGTNNLEKIYCIDFDNLTQMRLYLNSLKDLDCLIKHKSNVPIAREVFQSKVDEILEKCTCSQKSIILSNLAYLYYDYIDVRPLPHHSFVTGHLFDSAEKYVL